jgi:hypothetical protein
VLFHFEMLPVIVTDPFEPEDVPMFVVTVLSVEPD